MATYLCGGELYHFGIKGMKWGVRKKREKGYTGSRHPIRDLNSARKRAALMGWGTGLATQSALAEGYNRFILPKTVERAQRGLENFARAGGNPYAYANQVNRKMRLASTLGTAATIGLGLAAGKAVARRSMRNSGYDPRMYRRDYERRYPEVAKGYRNRNKKRK